MPSNPGFCSVCCSSFWGRYMPRVLAASGAATLANTLGAWVLGEDVLAVAEATGISATLMASLALALDKFDLLGELTPAKVLGIISTITAISAPLGEAILDGLHENPDELTALGAFLSALTGVGIEAGVGLVASLIAKCYQVCDEGIAVQSTSDQDLFFRLVDAKNKC